MKLFSWFALLIVILIATADAQSLFAQGKEADAVTGIWLNESGKAHIKIFKRGGKYYGKIVWLRDPNDKNGKPKVDKENSEEKLQKKPLLGLEILTGFEYDEDREWDDGDIYDPQNGKTYSCTMTLEENNNILDVRGYVGFSFIGRSQTWTRVKK